MISGIRLTQLDHGEPLLGTSFTYNDYTGVQAAEKRLERLFSIINYFGFNFVIDTINPELDVNGNLHLKDNGLYGHIWSFDERMAIYRKYQSLYGFKLVMEVNLPDNLNESNWKKYAEFIKSLMIKYNDISYWQICNQPETVTNQQYKCDPVSYVRLIKSLYSVKLVMNDLQLGAPGIFQGLIDFYNNKENCWLNRVIGDVYKYGDQEYEVVGNNGILDYIDFFSIHGRQEVAGLRYDVFGSVIEKLRSKINEKIGKDITILSINQGRTSSSKDQKSLDTQGYYEIKEMLNAYRYGVYGFKNQLIDEYSDPYAWGGYFNENLKDRGLLYYNLDENTMYKPASNTYQFILNALKEYNYVGPNNRVSELNANIESITLYNGDPNAASPTYQPTKSATIIWSNSYAENYVVLTPHYAREYMLKIGEPISLTQSVQIDFSEYDFVIVYETIEKDILDIDNIKDSLNKKLSYTEKTMVDLISSLPNSYNKEITDINYYKLLRSLSLELADAQVEIHKVKHNSYLEDVESDYLYKNFGVLVGLNKKSGWDDDKYKRLVKGVTKSLLDGPTAESITEAVKLFTNFDVKIKELYADENASATVGTDRTQFIFALEVEKPLDVSSSYDEIIGDVDYVIDIVKPAHTLRLVIISLVGEEDYKEQYKDRFNKEFKDGDKMQSFDVEKFWSEGSFGWKDIEYDGQMKTAGSEFIEYDPLINGGLFLGPRYSLFDDMTSLLNIDAAEEVIKEWVETLDSLLSFERDEIYHDVKESINIDAIFSESEHKFGLNVNDIIQLRGRKIIDGILVTNKILNKYKLGFSSKLKDEDKIEFDSFNSEKYIFRNLINPFIFRDNTDSINPNVNHFPFSINGQFTYSQDILSEMHQMFKELYLTDDKKENMEKVDLDLSFYNDEYKFGYDISDPLNPIYKLEEDQTSKLKIDIEEQIDNPEDIYHIENKYFEIYDDIDDFEKMDWFIDNSEFYRDYDIVETEPKHVKFIKQIVDSNNIYRINFPNDVIVSLDYYHIDVFVNGKMLNEKLFSFRRHTKYRNYCIGVGFNESLKENDVVILRYYQNRQSKIKDFPIIEEWENCISDNKEEKYLSLYEIEDKLNIEYINNETFKEAKEEIDTIVINHIDKEVYDSAKEIEEILQVDLPILKEDTDFKREIYLNKRFKLCGSKLSGQNVLFGKYYEKIYLNSIEVTSFEKIKSAKEKQETTIIDYQNFEIVKKPVDVIVFYLDGQENNIVKDKNIIDESIPEYCRFETYQGISDELTSSDFEFTSLNEIYKMKKQEYSNGLLIYYDEMSNFKDNIIDHCYNMGMMTSENVDSPKDSNVHLMERYDLENNINKCIDNLKTSSYMVKEKENYKLQDNLKKSYKFNNMMRFVGDGEIINGEQIVNNGKVTLYKFPYKPIIDYVHTEISMSDKYNKAIINNFIANNNNFYHEKYSFKEDTFEFS